MSDQLIVERGGLEKKDKSELQAIVSALGGSASSRARKADLIDQILELSGAALPSDAPSDPPDADAESTAADGTAADAMERGASDADSSGQDAGDTEDTERGRGTSVDSSTAEAAAEAVGSDVSVEGEQLSIDGDGSDDAVTTGAGSRGSKKSRGDGGDSSGGAEDSNRENAPGGRQNGRGRRSRAKGSSAEAGDHPVGPDGEPLADWEVEVMADADPGQNQGQGQGQGQGQSQGQNQNQNQSQGQNQGQSQGQNQGQNQGKGDGNRNKQGKDRKQGGGGENREDTDPNNRRNRRRGRGRGRDRDDAGNDPISADPLPVSGSLDLRDEGYGFLRVAGHLPSKDDVYVSVKQVRQYGLRKGDQLTGLSRPANRNEKNPGFHQIDTVNGQPPEDARKRPRFEELTPLFPDERLVMSMREEPLNMTTRIIDLVAPLGKGQRALIVSPPKAGKTTVIKDIARAIETNNPEVRLMVLLVDERPEEVTDMRRSLKNGEVAASTFDRPPEEHCAVAELTIERAKRLVEAGEDVCVILDGITRLARAYNLSVPQTGRAMSGGLDAGALYPPKRFLGAARNLEEGGSLTILATALVETGSRMDEVIFEEFKGTGNSEIRLDRRLAEKRVFPAIDIDGSSTRNEELLFDAKQLKQAWKLRRVLSGMSEEGTSAAGIEMLIDRLQTFKTNDDFLAEIGKAPSV